jgi:hypothetical protein
MTVERQTCKSQSRSLGNPLDLVHHVDGLEDSGGNLERPHCNTNRRATRNEIRPVKVISASRRRCTSWKKSSSAETTTRPILRRALQMFFIRSPQQVFVCRGQTVYVSPSSAIDPRIHALVEVQSERHPSSNRRSVIQTAGITEAHFGNEGTRVLPFGPDQRLALVKISQRRVHIGERKMRMNFLDYVRCHSEMLELVGDLADLDVRAPNHRAQTRVVDVGRGLSCWFPAQSKPPANGESEGHDAFARRVSSVWVRTGLARTLSPVRSQLFQKSKRGQLGLAFELFFSRFPAAQCLCPPRIGDGGARRTVSRQDVVNAFLLAGRLRRGEGIDEDGDHLSSSSLTIIGMPGKHRVN